MISHDPMFVNYLLARYEKSRAIEMSDCASAIDTPEYQQYLLTIGNPAFQKQAEKMAQTERSLQHQCDVQVISSCKREFISNASNLVNTSYNFTSEKVLFDYTNAVNAQQELEQKVKVLSEENKKFSLLFQQISNQN